MAQARRCAVSLKGNDPSRSGSARLSRSLRRRLCPGFVLSVGVRILVNLGADPGMVCQQVNQMLPGYQGQEPRPAVGPSQLRARLGSQESAVSQDRLVDALTAIGDRLTAIERRLGISRQSPPGPFDEQIAELRRAKEAAIDSRDFEQAAALRDQEKRLIAQQEASVRGQEPSGPGGSARQG